MIIYNQAGPGVPTAMARSMEVVAGESVACELRGFDPDGHLLTFEVIENPTRGTLDGAAPWLIYTPTGSHSGTDKIRFSVSGPGGSSSATVTFVISGSTIGNGGDLNDDGVVNLLDLHLIVQHFGSNNVAGDADADGDCDANDFRRVAESFGRSF